MKSKIKLKPWGREIWFAQAKSYAGKILEIKKGERLSLQFHRKKEETQYLFEGKVRIIYGKSEKNLKNKILKVGEAFHIPPKMIHRIEYVLKEKIQRRTIDGLDHHTTTSRIPSPEEVRRYVEANRRKPKAASAPSRRPKKTERRRDSRVARPA